MNGLTNSEFGNCCVLSRIRNLRTTDVNKIKDQKERQKIIEAQKYYSLDEENYKEVKYTEEERKKHKQFSISK